MGIAESLKNVVVTLQTRPNDRGKALSVLRRLTQTPGQTATLALAIVANKELCAELVKGMRKATNEEVHSHCIGIYLYMSSSAAILPAMCDIPGILPALVDAMNYTTRNSKSFSVHILANMCLSTASVPFMFETPNLMQTLIKNLKTSQNFEVTAGSASCIANFAFWKGCHEVLFTSPKYEGLVQALVRGLQPSVDDSTRHHAARALTNMSAETGAQNVFNSPGLLQNLVRLLSSGSEQVKLQLCGLLSNLSAPPQHHKSLLKFPKLLDVVLSHLMFGDVSMQYWACRIFHHFAIEASNLPTLRPIEGLEVTVLHILANPSNDHLTTICVNLAAALAKDTERDGAKYSKALAYVKSHTDLIFSDKEITIGGRAITVTVGDLWGATHKPDAYQFGNLEKKSNIKMITTTAGKLALRHDETSTTDDATDKTDEESGSATDKSDETAPDDAPDDGGDGGDDATEQRQQEEGEELLLGAAMPARVDTNDKGGGDQNCEEAPPPPPPPPQTLKEILGGGSDDEDGPPDLGWTAE